MTTISNITPIPRALSKVVHSRPISASKTRKSVMTKKRKKHKPPYIHDLAGGGVDIVV